MRYIYNDKTDPAFNLAAEEYLATNYSEDVFMLWRNSPSVIIGKNQNALAEVDLGYAEKEGISVFRRITGGGAVFHDLGNINYTYIAKGAEEIDFEKFAAPVISALKKMGLSAELGGRNDIICEGFKISGNAQCRVSAKCAFVTLHHGTLLFGAELSRLASVLRPNPLKLQSKGIKSVSSRVKNIINFESYDGPRDSEGFIGELFRLIGGEISSFDEKELSEISALAQEKYSTWEWNYGSAPSFELEREKRFSFGTVKVGFSCFRGRIEKISFSGDFFGEGCERLEGLLKGSSFEKGELQGIFEREEALVKLCIHGADAEALISLFFEP